MFSTIERFDRAVRRELNVPSSAWIREAGQTVEVRLGESPAALGVAINEGSGGWRVRLPDGIVFTADAFTARRLLWTAAASVPTRPTTAPRPAPQRRGWDYYRSPTDD